MKTKFKFFVALSATALLSLTACGQRETKYADETDEAIISQLEVANREDGVYGNIYLPTEIEGATVTWKSEKPNIIVPYYEGDKAPGTVKRPATDTGVKVTAIIDKNGVKTQYVQTVEVKAAPKQLTDDDYEAYLFGHFVGEGDQWGKTVDGKRVTKGEQMFFALADVGQGLKFKDMNGSKGTNYDSLKPVLTSEIGERGVRDPYICRSPEGDTFYLIATDLSVYTRGGWGNNAGQATKTGSHSILLWESHDLVNWTEERLIKVARDDAGMAWAPEMVYCEETGEYLIFFSSTVVDDYSKGTESKILERDCVYYTTTRDFYHFTEAKKFIPNVKYPDGYTNKEETDQYAINNDYRKVIDGSVMKIGDYYYSACKDGGNNENHGGIRIQRTQNLYDAEWEFVMNLADAGFQAQNRNADNKCLEGPEWFYLNKADRADPNVPEVGIMADFYANTSVGYIPWTTTDITDTTNARNSWKQLTSGTAEGNFNWDNNGNVKRHGTILRITAEEAARLKEYFPGE